MTAARSVLRDVSRVTAAAVAAGAVAAGVVGLLALGSSLRSWFGLTPEQPVDVPVAELRRVHAEGLAARLH